MYVKYLLLCMLTLFLTVSQQDRPTNPRHDISLPSHIPSDKALHNHPAHT